jgi:hypothetical protein
MPTDPWAGPGGRETHPQRQTRIPVKSTLDAARDTESARESLHRGQTPADSALAGLRST